MRATDVRLLRVQQIHDDIIDLAQSKTSSEQQWEITPAVQAILGEAASLPGRARSLYVLPTLRGTPYTESGFQSMRRRALAAVGLKAVVRLHSTTPIPTRYREIATAFPLSALCRICAVAFCRDGTY